MKTDAQDLHVNPDEEHTEACSKVLGVGVDIVEIERIEKIIDRSPRFIKKVFTPEEISYSERAHRPAIRYAARFAVREAVCKALDIGLGSGNLHNISVTHNKRGRPIVKLDGHAQKAADEQGVIDVQISISRTHTLAVANAVAITEEAVPEKEETFDISHELELKFKEAKHLLE